MPQWIKPSGPQGAAIAVVGRDCGWDEMREQRGFVGQSGKLIWHPTRHSGAADLAGLPRASCLVTNVVNTQPSANEWSNHREPDIARGMEELQHTLGAAPRRLVVALGEQAALGCVGITPERDGARVSAQFVERFGDSITNVRGYIYVGESGGAARIPILVALHPAFILRNWHPWWATFQHDWQKAARIAREGYTEHRVEVEVIGEAETLRAWWARQAPGTVTACDIETSGTGCVGFAASDHHAVVVPGMPAPDHPMHEALSAVLNDPRAHFALANGWFDWWKLADAGMVPERSWPQYRDDIQLLWHTLEPLLAGSQKDEQSERKKKNGRRTEKSLRFLASLLVDGAAFWKNYAFESDSDQFRLCGLDCAYTRVIRNELVRRLAIAA